MAAYWIVPKMSIDILNSICFKFIQEEKMKIVTSESKKIFHEKYVVKPNGCWEWQTRAEYGHFCLKKINISASNFSYMAFIGPIKRGHIVDHLCMNKKCVNPNHLEMVTKSDNASKRREKLKKKILSEDGGIITDRIRGIKALTLLKEEGYMSFGDRLKDAIDRSYIVDKWRPRLDRSDIKHYKFCEKHNIDHGQFSRWLTKKNSPEWPSIETVEKALKAEGV